MSSCSTIDAFKQWWLKSSGSSLLHEYLLPLTLGYQLLLLGAFQQSLFTLVLLHPQNVATALHPANSLSQSHINTMNTDTANYRQKLMLSPLREESAYDFFSRLYDRIYATVLCLSVCRLSVTYVLRLNDASHRKTVWRSKEEIDYWESNGHVTDDLTWPWKVKVTHDPNMLRAQYLKNSWICYLATIANYYIVGCEAAGLAILATAWFLV